MASFEPCLGPGGGPPPPRPELAALEPYVPGRPAASEDGSLASNESPFGVSPSVERAISEAIRHLHRYPDPLARRLRLALAAEHGVEPDAIVVGNGSDELIYLLVLAYATGGSVVCADPAYRLDDIVPRIMGASVTKVPLRSWVHDLDAMARVEADVAFVCNPHNPTGTVVLAEDLRSFVDGCRARLVVVDEAYVDFVDNPDRTTLVPEARGKLVVLRTFSKLFGLAGGRIGYMVGDPAIVEVLRKIRPPFSVGTLGQAAALAALEDTAHRAWVRDQVRQTRRQMTALFEAAGHEVVPSQANFVLVLSDDTAGLEARLERHGVSVRPGATLGVPGAVRVAVPSPKGLALLERALD